MHHLAELRIRTGVATVCADLSRAVCGNKGARPVDTRVAGDGGCDDLSDGVSCLPISSVIDDQLVRIATQLYTSVSDEIR